MTIIGHGFGAKACTPISHGYGSFTVGAPSFYRLVTRAVAVSGDIERNVSIQDGIVRIVSVNEGISRNVAIRK